MSVLPFLPTFDVYVAFSPTTGATLNTAYSEALPSSGSSNSYWTNVSEYLRELQTQEGRQHFLDRMEAGTLTVTLNGRDGFFWNGTVNTTGQVIGARLPIAVTATWSSTTYPQFFGFIDSAKEKITDQLNSDVEIQASDQLKQLSLRRLETPQFWSNYTHSTSVTNYYDCTTSNTAVITAATGNGTTVTYTGFNNFVVGDTITITGLSVFSGTSLNLVNVVVATASGSGFTVTNATVGVSSGTGSGYRSRILDLIGGNGGLYEGTVSFPNAGAIIYTNNGCADLANGSSAATGYLQLPIFFGTTYGALDFWILGQGIANSLVTLNVTTSISGSPANLNFAISQTGYPTVTVPSVSATTVTSTVKVDDGYWHHVGLVCDSSGHLQLYVDGVFTSLSAIATCTGWTTITGDHLLIGNTSPSLGAPAMYVDEVCVSSNSHLAGLQGEVSSRYIAGTLLQLPTNPGGPQVLSGDRIAQVLCLAGYGTVSGGAVVLNSNLFYINNGSAWVNGTSGNGYVNVQPWYWDAPVYNSTALDLIYQICDTDVGRFWQKRDGTFAYHNQNFFGAWDWATITAISSTSTTWTFTAANSFSAGQGVAIVGCYPLAYNGIYTVATASGTQFTITHSGNPGAGVAFGNAGGWLPNTYTPTTYHAWSDDASTTYPYDGPTLDAPWDEADVWTSVQVTPQAGIDQVFENTQAEAQFGYNTLTSTSTLHTTLNLAMSTAVYEGYLFRSPLTRVQGVTLLAETDNGANNLALINVGIDDVCSFKRVPPNSSSAGQINQNMVVESRALDFNAESGVLRATYCLDPYPVRA